MFCEFKNKHLFHTVPLLLISLVILSTLVEGYTEGVKTVSQSDIDIVKNRFKQYEFYCPSEVNEKGRLYELIKNVPVGSNYKPGAGAPEWERAVKLFWGIACGYDSSVIPGKSYTKHEYDQRLNDAVNFHMQSDHSDIGWHALYYGTPYDLSRVFLFLWSANKEGRVPKDAFNKAKDFLRRYASTGVFSYNGGHNTMIPALSALQAGLYFNDIDLVQRGADRARYGLIQVSTKDETNEPNYGCLQKDWSFFEHGQGLNAVYGHDGFMLFSKYFRLTYDTNIDVGNRQVPNDPLGRTSIELWTDWYKNFIRWTAYNGYVDPYISQKHSYNTNGLFSKIVRAIDAIKNTNYIQPKIYSREMSLLRQRQLDFDGAIAYPVGNYLVSRRKTRSGDAGFYASVRLVNIAMPGEELSSFSSEMGNMFFVTRSDYSRLNRDNILYYPSGVLNSVTFPESLLNKIHRAGRNSWGGSGTISCGKWYYWGQSTLDSYYAMAAENIDSSKIKMQKSWFIFDNEIVSLASGISSGEHVKTWIDTFEKDDSVLDTSTGQKSIDVKEDIGRLTWMQHDNTGYIFIGGKSIKGERVNDNIDSIPVNKRIPHYRYYIDHGASPSDDQYKMVYLPGASSSKTQNYANNPDIEVLRLDDKLHLVREKKQNVVGAAFFGSATHNLVSSNLPAYILYRDSGSGFSFSVHNPNREPKSLEACGWRTGEDIPTLSSKVDYKVSEAEATKYTFSITLPKSFSKASDCYGCDLFSLSNNGMTIGVLMRPFRKFEFNADKENRITKAWISFNDAIEVDSSPTPEHCGNGICDSDESSTNCPSDCNCQCSSWQNDKCGGGSCSQDKMHQTRTCTHSGCMIESQCVESDNCKTPSHNITITKGWNLVFIYTEDDIPLSSLSSCGKTLLFSLEESKLVRKDNMLSGNSYLLRASKNCEIELTDSKTSQEQMQINSGWNVLGVQETTPYNVIDEACSDPSVFDLNKGRLVVLNENNVLHEKGAYLVKSQRECSL